MKRMVSLWLPSFVTDRLSRPPAKPGSADWQASPLATIAKVQGRLTVIAANAAAQAEGVATGQALADARALLPELRVADAAPEAERQALAELADWCTRFTPWVAAEPLAPGGGQGVLLDIAGCAHLFGGETRLIADLVGRLARQGYAARAAIADTAGAAWAVARYAPAAARADLVIPSGGQRQALAPLPVAALRLPPETAEALAGLGLRRIGDLYAMPRAPLVRRFGALVCRRLDEALGRLDEALSPQAPLPSFRLDLAFAEPVGRPEDIAAGLERLVAALCRRLGEEGKGVRRLEFTLFRADGSLARAAIGTSRPARDPCHLLRLFREHLERLDPGFGVDLLRLAPLLLEPLAESQAELAVAGANAAADDGAQGPLAALIDRLANRLGNENVRRIVPRESHLPERAAQLAPHDEAGPAAWPKGRPRPLRLLPRPEEVDAVAPVPDDPPHLFRWGRQLHRIRRADGPERIAPEWWRSDAAAEPRDYYRVEDLSGRRFWLYREGFYRPGRPARWFLHGLFA